MKTKTLHYVGREVTFTARDFDRLMAEEGTKYALDHGLFYKPRTMRLVENKRRTPSDHAEQQDMIRLLRAANPLGQHFWNQRERKWLAEHPLKPEAKPMKTTRSQEIIEKARELMAITKARIELKKREDELKQFFLNKMGSEDLLKAGELLIVISDRNRTDLDREALVARFGEKIVAKFLKTTTYQTVEVKTA